EVPDDTPMVPLQRDLLRESKRLALRQQPELSTLSLDLRVPQHLERSHLLHRLELLDIPWGKKEPVQNQSGTFHEVWKVRWQPELTIRLIEKSIFGTTLYYAATDYARQVAAESGSLPDLTGMVNSVLLAGLPDAVGSVTQHLQESAALTDDVKLLMA